MSVGRRIFLSLAFVLLAASAVMQVKSGNAGDKGWLLLAARMWLSGKRLYVDIFELDPPFVVWLYAIPEWVSQHAGLSDSQALAIFGLLACALSILLASRLMRFHPAFAGDGKKQLNFALLLAFVFVFFNTQVYFFDREHIFLVLTFPYMLRFMPSLARRRLPLALRVIIGVVATVGFCIKPYTLVVFAILQLLYIVRERSLAIVISAENILIYLGGACYLLCVWFFTREYIDVVMPMALLTYSGFSRRVNGYLFLSLAFISAGLTFAELRLRHETPYRRDAYYFIGVCGAFLVYALANNGWGYTYNLLLCMLIFASGWMLWDYSWLKSEAERRGETTQKFTFARHGCLANLALNAAYMLLCLGTFFTTASCDKYIECHKNSRYADYFKAHDVHSFGTLTVNLRMWTALVRQTGAAWDTRFHTLWMLPKFMQEGEPFTRQHIWVVDYVGKALAEDLNTRRPAIVIVDTSNAIFGYPHPVDMIGYFSRVPEFKAAWKHYTYDATIDQCAHPEGKPEPVQTDCSFAIYRHVEGEEKSVP